MTAILNKTSFGYLLTIVSRPCGRGEPEFMAGEHIAVNNKHEAKSICKARGIKPWGF